MPLNYAKLHQTYPKAFLEWVRKTVDEHVTDVPEVSDSWMKVDYSGGGYGNFPLGVLDSQLRELPEYFDEMEIHVNAHNTGQVIGASVYTKSVVYNINDFGEWYDLVEQIKHPDPKYLTSKCFPTRLLALEAGIVKAFEIREGVLNEMKTEN